jgi:predicted Rossmann-fold nucleotide-binding protein
MRRRVGRVVEVESLAAFDALVAGGARHMRGWRMRGVDLRRRTAVLLGLDPSGALLLGCRLTRRADQHLRADGAVVFPELPAVPVDAYRSALYAADELYAGLADGYPATLDGRAYAWSQGPGVRPDAAVAQVLHDAAIEEALDDLVAGRRVVGVMGGHAAERGTPAYREAAELGRALARDGALVTTGGGPGTMEAVNLGAAMAGHADGELDHAIAILAAVPSFRPSVDRWATVALAVRARWPGDGGLGIPTWAYGHEPPNVFPGAIAKYFQNAVREATLARRCAGGIAFLPGAAGTVQELFQDACENYYAEPPMVAPMVLVGIEHWTAELPAWPLLRALAAGRNMASRTHLADTVADAARLLGGDVSANPSPPRGSRQIARDLLL